MSATKGRGRPTRPLDLAMIQKLAQFGLTVSEIAEVVGVSERTLHRRSGVALRRGRARLNISLRRLQLRAARRGSVPMLIWLGKVYLGQTDRQEIIRGERVRVVEEVLFPRAGESAAAVGDGNTD